MEATVVDLRYKMNDVLKALSRNEKVTVLYRGKKKGVLMPIEKKVSQKVSDHSFFGMSVSAVDKTVLEELDDLRRTRYDVI